MAQIIMVVDVDTGTDEGDVNPTLVDPHEVAAEILDDFDNGTHREWPRVRSYEGAAVTFVSAEWAT